MLPKHAGSNFVADLHHFRSRPLRDEAFHRFARVFVDGVHQPGNVQQRPRFGRVLFSGIGPRVGVMEVEQKLETGLLQGPRQRQGVWKIVALGSVAAWRMKQAQARPIKPGLLQKTGGIFNGTAIAIAQATACRDRAEERKVGTVNTRPVRGHFPACFSKRTVRALSE